MSVHVETAWELAVSRPRRLLEWQYFRAEIGRTYDVSRPDGDRFLAIRIAGDGSAAASQPPRAEVVLDWFSLLNERVSGPG
jgi:hypothetical protein